MKNRYLLTSIGVLILTVIFSLFSGSSSVSPTGIFSIILHPTSTIASSIIWDIRLPRIFLAILVGAALSVAGGILQTVFRNPIADPSFLGISSGAALGTVTGLLIGTEFGSVISTFFGVLGSLVAISIITILTRNDKQSIAGLILIGVAINAIFIALLSFILSISNNPQARSLSFWNLGTLSLATWDGVSSLLLFSMLGISFLIIFGRKGNLLSLPDLEIRMLGVDPRILKFSLSVSAAILVGASTSIVGVISFIGLLIPFIIRLFVGPHIEKVLPLSAIWGSILMLSSDTLARSAISSLEIPIGSILAIIGAPTFLFLLIRKVKTK